ncbi:low-specificity L-threonine aldolase [Chromobacterium phragmitis]|uniref:Low-specificity L-threonine aldolase n=1 Tax=Chromobacterium phragmitis TaxID=2202141 RepID=A0A344UJW4_9NEIS|nr:low-specificity L-threonine aldolase [Chromobacterium phragmitis]AXE30167.1 low-specificity L-threonine aldolase [Chromobacterium phragmitis]AXE35562.1 low-specificity L-threonine aldolase [Chromobacterium phragmitis]
MQKIDLRSDTVTQPTPAMRQAMFDAPLGDDCYGDDPTVLKLEALAADKLGKEAALFVPSGTFGNQLALFTHCRRGDEVIIEDNSHIVSHEAGAAAVIAGVHMRAVEGVNGLMAVEQIERRIRVGDDIHEPRTGLICLENAHSNGRVLPLAAMADTAALAREYGVPVHLDGARVFNAAASLGCDAREVVRHVDSVMFCLSKGLAAPVGSMLAGREDFIEQARRKRKLMGGGLRQAGVLAAPGILALTEMAARLDEDHANARYLAEGLAKLPCVDINPADTHINLVWFRFNADIDSAELMAALEEAGFLANPPHMGMMRLVTHWQVSRADIDRLLEAMQRVLSD